MQFQTLVAIATLAASVFASPVATQDSAPQKTTTLVSSTTQKSVHTAAPTTLAN
ncbi:hypothetical protein C6P44_001266 [Monosporozyma unispora]|nr:hypothetical protein C6P44_001266 [Kazachstania unispora]